MSKIITLGPFAGHSFTPSYQLQAYRNGNPAKPIPKSALDLRSAATIQTVKNMQDASGTFTITLKDRRAMRQVREMDVFRIRLSGHRSPTLTTVLRGVVDSVTPGGSADVAGSENHVTISGRCVGKYVQVASLFLPVWDPDGALPTALTFGLGDVTQKGSPTYKAGGTRPYDIWQYIVENYLFGTKDQVGTSGIPNSVHWLHPRERFAHNVGLNVPFLQFDEDSLATVLQSLQVLGFTETWIDEIGRIVYRKPQWDQPIRYTLPAGNLIDWDFSRSDDQTATYVEVIPVGDPGIDSGTAQALRAGRAPVPSSYVRAGGTKTQLGKYVSDEFIIETDKHGQPTAKGRANPWWQRQRRLGLRPQQVQSPLIVTQEQAQAQAEGLLRFYSRMDKQMQLTFPGCPEVRLGFTLRCHGELEGEAIDRTGYLEQVTHSYTETTDGGQYTTSIACTHGRDAIDPFTNRPDPKWGEITLPKYNPADLADGNGSGVLDSGGGNAGSGGGQPASVGYPLAKRGSLIGTPYVGTHAKAFNVAGGSDNWESENAIDIGVPTGTAVFAVSDGTIGPEFGSLGSGGRFAGLRLHLVTSDNEWYYAHLSSFYPGIKPGVKVKKGDRLGSSGEANGVQHLHIACLTKANPQTLLGWGGGS